MKNNQQSIVWIFESTKVIPIMQCCKANDHLFLSESEPLSLLHSFTDCPIFIQWKSVCILLIKNRIISFCSQQSKTQTKDERYSSPKATVVPVSDFGKMLPKLIKSYNVVTSGEYVEIEFRYLLYCMRFPQSFAETFNESIVKSSKCLASSIS